MEEARRKLLASTLLGLLTACGGGGGEGSASRPDPDVPPGPPPSGPSTPPPPLLPPPAFAYITGTQARQLIGFELDRQCGTLTQVGDPVATGAGPRQIIADPLGQALYVTAFYERRVRSFAVTESGAPSVLTESDAAFFCWGAAVHPSGQYVFATNQGNDRVEILASDSLTGSLNWLGFAFAFNLPTALAMHPNGLYLYVSQTSSNNVGIFSFDDKTGELHRLSDVQLPPGATQPHALAIDPSARLLYVSAVGGGGERLCTFSILEDGGTLIPLDDLIPSGTACRGVAVHPTGRFVFAAYSASNLVSVYEMLNESLTLVGDFQTGSTPMGVAVDPTGKFLYVLNQDSDTVSIYTIGSNGSLAPADSPALALPQGFGPNAIAFVEKIPLGPETVSPRHRQVRLTPDAAAVYRRSAFR